MYSSQDRRGEAKLSRECVFFGQELVQYEAGGRKGSHGLHRHSYPITAGVKLSNAVATAYDDSMQRD